MEVLKNVNIGVDDYFLEKFLCRLEGFFSAPN